MHADPSIQFAPLPPVAPPPPASGPSALEQALRALFEPIGMALGLHWEAVRWLLLAVVVLAVLYAAGRLALPLIERRRARAAHPPEEWTPRADEAAALLDDADRLAATGRFDEATHLLLVRSVQHIAAARPGSVQTASTAREIARLPGLSDGARSTFGLIAARVERSLFARRPLAADDWQAAREAYACFALERLA